MLAIPITETHSMHHPKTDIHRFYFPRSNEVEEGGGGNFKVTVALKHEKKG